MESDSRAANERSTGGRIQTECRDCSRADGSKRVGRGTVLPAIKIMVSSDLGYA